MVGSDIDEGVEMYVDYVRGDPVQIGYLLEDGEIDKVHTLIPFESANAIEASGCVLQMLDRS